MDTKVKPFEIMGKDAVAVCREHPEWERMWSALHSQYEDHTCPRSNEVWQYMGTWGTSMSGWQHQFRHRSYHGERKYVDIAPSAEFMEQFNAEIWKEREGSKL